jgi:hypothetical protein
MSFPTTPKWAKDKNYFWHSNPESRPLDVTYFDKCIIRPKVDLAWQIIKEETEGDIYLAQETIQRYDNDNANMFAGRTIQEMADKYFLEDWDQEKCIDFGSKAFNKYHPRKWDDGKDQRKLDVNRDEFATVFKNAIEGIKEAANHLGINKIEGESEVFANIPGLVLPYYGKPDFSKQIELKTKWSSVNLKSKSGSRANSLPLDPTWPHLCQVSGYWFEKKRPQAIVYANKLGYRTFSESNCERLSEDALTSTINYVASKCRIREGQLQKAANSIELIKLVEPDFGHFFGWDRHPDVVEEAKQLWGFR